MRGFYTKKFPSTKSEWCTTTTWGRVFDFVVGTTTQNYYLLFFKIRPLSGAIYCTGCSLNIVFFSGYLKTFRTLAFLCFPRCQCVYTHQAGRKQALQQNWQSSEKSHFKEKIYNTDIFN